MNTGKASRLFYLIALLSLLLALALCFLPRGAALLLFPTGSAEEVADSFFAALEAGDYCAASALCSPALPAEEIPTEQDSSAVYAALCESRRWEREEAAVRRGSTASVTGSYTALDLAALTENLREEVGALLQQRVNDAALGSEVYNEDGSYKDELVLSVWQQALSARLEESERYCVTRQLSLTLRYSHGEWLIEPDEALLNALAGGAA